MRVCLLLQAASPAPKPRPTAFHQRGTPGHPCPTTLTSVGSLCPGTVPPLQAALPEPRFSQLDGAGWGGFCCPSFPGLPPTYSSRVNFPGWEEPPEGTTPNGSTELTLDNEGLRRKGRERLRDLGIFPAGHPKQKWGPGCLWFGNLGRRGLGEESPYPHLIRILLNSSGPIRVGREQAAPAPPPPPPVPNSEDGGRVEGAGLLLLLPQVPSPTWLFLPYRAGAGEQPLLEAWEATWPQGTSVQSRR